MKQFAQIGFLFFAIVVILMIIAIASAQYNALKEYYPDLTIYEYVLLSNKMRITPGDCD